ncbi:MAG: aldo/keto reductase, partial [Myxococcota bacterium]
LGHDEDLGSDKTVEALEARAHAIMDAAYDHGVRYFDAARSYGRAEAFVGGWLSRRTPRDVCVGSKWGYRYAAGWQVDAEVHEVKEHSRSHFAAQLAQTRALLGPALALYQVHSATLTSGLFDAPDLLDALTALRDEGVVIGLSLSGPGQAATLRRALAVERSGRPLFGAVQATWNLLERSVGPALVEARERGVGVIVKEALANGRLTDRGEPFPALEKRARRLGVGIDALALAAVLAQPFADTVLSGAATVAHLQSNLDAIGIPAAEAEAALGEVPIESAETYWARRKALTWG